MSVGESVVGFVGEVLVDGFIDGAMLTDGETLKDGASLDAVVGEAVGERV